MTFNSQQKRSLCFISDHAVHWKNCIIEVFKNGKDAFLKKFARCHCLFTSFDNSKRCSFSHQKIQTQIRSQEGRRIAKYPKGFQEEQILSYGHCTGEGPALYPAEKHPRTPEMIDRTATAMAEFTAYRVSQALYLPSKLRFLVNWVKAIDDGQMVFLIYLQRLFDQATQAKTRTLIYMNCDHNVDIAPNEQVRQQIGTFLKNANLLD